MDIFLEWVKANLAVAAAMVTGAVALVSVFLNARASRRLETAKAGFARDLEGLKASTQQQLETFKADLTNRNSAEAAKRDYEYTARKRLYTQIEPILFQLAEASESAFLRVAGLVRTYRDGDLAAPDSWLDDEGYFLRSTAYRLLLPAVYTRLMQRRMTFVDMSLERSFRSKYYLQRMFNKAWTDDFKLAGVEPPLPYDPDKAGRNNNLKKDPKKYRLQGLYAGELDNLVEALVTGEKDAPRPKTFGEFEADLKQSPRPELYDKVVNILRDFTPEGTPVAARMFQVLGTISHLTMTSLQPGNETRPMREMLSSFLDSPDFADKIAWRRETAAHDRDVIERYLTGRFAWDH